MSDKSFNIIRIGLLLIGLIVGALYFIGIQGKTESEIVSLSQTNLISYLTYAFFAIAVAIAFIAPIIIIIKNPRSAKSILLGIVLLAALFFLAYILASSSTASASMQKREITESTSKLVGTGILLTYILAGLAIITMIFSGFTKLFK